MHTNHIAGYLFLFNMFIVVVQSEGVIDIFFDAMALQVRAHCLITVQ